MSSFATQEQCSEVLDLIDGLITSGGGQRRFRKDQLLASAVVPINGRTPRVGLTGANHHKEVPLNPRIPRAWSASMHEPHDFNNFGIISDRVKRSSSHADQPHFGSFQTYGLDIYSASDDWNMLTWDVVQVPAQRVGELAIFMFGLGPTTSAATAVGHVAHDELQEARSLAETGHDVLDIHGDSMIFKHSQRLTEDGAEFLTSILHYTKAYELTKNENLIHPRQLTLNI